MTWSEAKDVLAGRGLLSGSAEPVSVPGSVTGVACDSRKVESGAKCLATFGSAKS